MTNIMLDLETMGTDHYAPVVAIGACRFDIHIPAITDVFYQSITLESCMEFGLKPSAQTIKWWMQQNHDAINKTFFEPNAEPLPIALDMFTDWYASSGDKLWGNSAAFDCGLLKDAYKACGKELPWAFYNEGCYRTLKGLPGADVIKIERLGTHHHALDDAISQAHHMQMICRRLNIGQSVPHNEERA